MESLRAYLNGLELEEQRRFAALCGTTLGYLRKAISTDPRLSPAICAQAEVHSGGAVTRIDLRPSDWHRIWPELIGTPGAPPVLSEERAHG